MAIPMKSIVKDKDSDIRTQRDLRESIIEKDEIGLWMGLQ
jgi:hypothetical protein